MKTGLMRREWKGIRRHGALNGELSRVGLGICTLGSWLEVPSGDGQEDVQPCWGRTSLGWASDGRVSPCLMFLLCFVLVGKDELSQGPGPVTGSACCHASTQPRWTLVPLELYGQESLLMVMALSQHQESTNSRRMGVGRSSQRSLCGNPINTGNIRHCIFQGWS